MQKLVDWLLERRIAVVLLVVVFAPTPNLSIISSAVMGLQWVWRGPAIAVGDALLACVAVTVIAIAAAGGPSEALPGAINACAAILIGCIVGGILRAAGGLTLAVQIILLIAFAGIAMFTLFGPSSIELFDAQIAQLGELMRQQGGTEEQIASISGLSPRYAGFFGQLLCLQVVLTLFLIAWLLGYARHSPEFGPQFRALRIGYVIGVPATLIIVLALLWNATLTHNLFGIAALAFMLQGLSLLHARGHSAGWHPVQYLPVYVMGVIFGVYLLFWGLLSDGLLD
jgi:hypothetical protein